MAIDPPEGRNRRNSMDAKSLPELPRRTFLQGAIAIGAIASGTTAGAQGPIQVWEESDPQCRIMVREVKPDYPVDAEMLADFINLSQVLTGSPRPLERALGSRYLDRLTSHPRLSPQVPALINTYRSIASGGNPPSELDVQQRIMQDSTLRSIAEQVIYVWYVSAFFLPRDDDPTKNVWVYGAPEEYERSLLWSIIGAHAPMTRGGPFGYWADTPTL
jgi:hypothetical protein